MRKSALLLAVLLAAPMSTNAYAKHRHHHRHHHRHLHHVIVPSPDEMKVLAFMGFASLFAPTPITILATSAADHAAQAGRRHRRR